MTRLSSRLGGLRGRLLVSVLVSIAVVLAALVAAFNLIVGDRLNSEADGVVHARAAAEVSALHTVGERIVLPEAPDDRNPDTEVWVFQGARPLEQPRSSVGTRVAAALGRSAPRCQDLATPDLRLCAIPVASRGRRLGAVVAAVSLAPYELTRQTALIASMLFAALVLLVVALAAGWLIDRALRPVAQMTARAAEWSEHDLDRRFALGTPTDELTQLAATLDELLDRLAAALRHEQRLSAEISHELRTPLSSIIAEAQYALRHDKAGEDRQATLEHILQSARQLGRTLDVLMAAARAQLHPPRTTADAHGTLRAALAASHAERIPDLEVSIDAAADGIGVSVEAELVERILVPILDNASRHARRSLTVSLARGGADVEFTIQDDGPGVPEAEREAIFQPGHRVADAPGTVTIAAGAGLGLALSRRLARSAGGDVHAAPSERGARFVVRLPAA